MNEDEMMNKIKKLSFELNEKIIENENYQQELHELRYKLKACLATQKDLSDTNELMEANLTIQQKTSEKRISNLLEKFAEDKKKFEERLSELQTSLSHREKKNDELRETLDAKDKLLATLRSEEPNERENSILKEKIDDLVHDLETRENIEGEMFSRQEQLEETNAELQKNYNEVRDMLQTKTVDLQSTKDILEMTKDELVVCRSELEMLKAVPASDSVKGNSLFAEVEDSRRHLINEMVAMKNKYLQMKQTYGAKELEIKTLRTERAAFLKKWEDNNVETIDQSARLIETYKSRIMELEDRLKMEEKKLRMNVTNKEQPAENKFSYLQSLLTAKKNEIQELMNKLEESSTQKILQEETKYEIVKELRLWRCKALSYQAQLLATQNGTKCKDCRKLELRNSGDACFSTETEQLYNKWTENPAPSLPDLNHSEISLEKLLKIPRASIETGTEKSQNLTDLSTITTFLDKPEENIDFIQLETTINVNESLPDSFGSASLIESASDQELNKENSSNINDTTLKSALAKSEDKSLRLKGQEIPKKSLRFTTETIDPQNPKLTRKKTNQKTYPIVFISSRSKK